MAQNQSFFTAILLGIISSAFTSSCQVYPSEYDYHQNSVSTAESTSPKCSKYSETHKVPAGVFPNEYFHCIGGNQLILANSVLGQESYSGSDYYEWSSNIGELLFIFPTRVPLTTITLHYYTDSVQGLPRLTFYPVSENFRVWDAPSGTTSARHITSNKLGGEPAGRRNVSININFNTKKVLLYKDSSSNVMFAMSEVEFFMCSPTTTTTTTLDPSATSVSLPWLNLSSYTITTTNSTSTKQENRMKNTTTATSSVNTEDPQLITIIAVGAAGSLSILLIIAITVALSLLLWYHKRRIHKQINSNKEENASYSTLNREVTQQTQPQDPMQLYDQIHLSPSTGQTELISNLNTQREAHKGISSTPISNVYSSIDTENSQPISSSKTETSKLPEDATYAVVNINKKRKKSREASDSSKRNDPTDAENFVKDLGKAQDQPSLEEMYAVVHKKPQKSEEQEEMAPSIPAYTVESLYTAVQKKPQ